MAKIQVTMAITLDGFLPEADNVSMQWVMNHEKGFARWRERCDARILPHSILDLLCEKDRREPAFIYLAEISSPESVELLQGLLSYNLVDELIIYLLPVFVGTGISVSAVFPSQEWRLYKTESFSNGICRLIYRNPRRK